MRIPRTTPSARTAALVKAAALADPCAVEVCGREGARTVQLDKPDAFALVWKPSRPRGVFISLPGTGSHAYSGASHWIEHCRRHNLALVVLQWWDGAAGYYTPAQISDIVLRLLALLGAEGLPRILHGHSRGATQTYALMGGPGDGHIPASGYLVQSGGYDPSYPPNVAMEAALAATERPLAGRRVVVVTGLGDNKIGKSDPKTMSASADVLERLGADVMLLSVGTGVPEDHGALTREAGSVDAAVAFLLGA